MTSLDLTVEKTATGNEVSFHSAAAATESLPTTLIGPILPDTTQPTRNFVVYIVRRDVLTLFKPALPVVTFQSAIGWLAFHDLTVFPTPPSPCSTRSKT
jgi:hypothetical protein